MVVRQTVCLRQLGGNRGGELQAGRFFATPKVTAAKIVAGWGEQTVTAVRGRHVLAIQDTTAVSFASYDESKTATNGLTTRRGLGPLNQGTAHGLLAHVMLAVDADSHACLGLVNGEMRNRDGFVSTPEWKRPLAERESRRWVETAEQAKPVLAQAAMVTVVSDREGDMYPLWSRVPTLGWHVLSRVRRPVVRQMAEAFAVSDTRMLQVSSPLPGQPKREAKVALRFGTVEIKRSPNEKDRSLAKTVGLTLVDVREVDPPADAEAIHWQLLTTHVLVTADQAWQVVSWYQARWCIEQLFRILKSQGLQLEDSQITAAERLTKLTAAAVKAACLILQLVQARDGADRQLAGLAFSEAQIQTVAALTPTLEGKTERQKNPHPPNLLAHASWVMARLGGWNCYGKPPGPITMHRGLQRFHAIHQGRMLALMPK
jgi:hypothetical protein